MRATGFRAPLVAAAFVGLLFASPSRSQAAPADPFAKVPALTTACYSDGDPYVAKIDAARDAARAELDQQTAVNAKIAEEYQKIDPMEMATRMQQWMMSNPQEAAKYMEAQQAIGAELQTAVPELNAAQQAFESEPEQLLARYEAALKQANAAADAKWDALNQKLAAGGCGFGDTECTLPEWAPAESAAIQKEWDAAYRATCAEWWSASGPMNGYLKRYREWLVGKYVPYWQKQDDVKVAQYAIMNTPAASYRSTIPLENAIEYMDVARNLFGHRESQPNCDVQGCRR